MLTQRRFSLKRIGALGCLLAFGVIVSTTWAVIQFRHDALTRREHDLTYIALLLAGRLDQDFTNLELVQLGIIEFFQRFDHDAVRTTRLMQSATVRAMLKEKISSLPNITGVSVFDQDGQLANTTRVWPVPDASIADRNYFRQSKISPGNPPTVSGLRANSIDGSSVFFVSRKIISADEEFLGIVVSGFGEKYLARSIGALGLSAGVSVTLARNDGETLAHYEKMDRNTPPADKRGKDVITVEQSLSSLPVKITLRSPHAVALAQWKQQTQLLVLVGVLLSALICAVFVALLRRAKSNYEIIGRLIRTERNLFDTAINNMSHGLVMYDSEARILVVNRKYLEMYDLPADIIKPGMTFSELLSVRKKAGTFAGDVEKYCSEIREDLRQGKAASVIAQSADGRYIQVSNNPLPTGGWVAILEDITQQRRAEIERDRNKEFLDQIIDHVPVTIIVKEALERKYVLVNRQAEKMWGLSREQTLGRTARELFQEDQADRIEEADNAALCSLSPVTIDAHPNTSGGQLQTVTSKRLALRDEDGIPQYLISVVEDITDRIEAQARIAHLAFNDALTDLPNRVSFYKKIEELYNSASSASFTVLYLDLDNFKNVNDSLGHPAGDALLKAVAGRLSDVTNKTEFIARLGGDEFAILGQTISNPHDVTELIKRVSNALELPFEISGQQVIVETSIGVAIAPTDGSDADSLLKSADLALYGAKAEGRNTFRFFETAMDAEIKERRKLEIGLRRALTNGEFEVYYQPIVDLKSGSVVSCEALLRWFHPERGTVSPAEFIPVAEECGLITQIGEWVLNTACVEARRWSPDIRVAVNVSSVQFRNAGLVAVVARALAESGLAPNRLELELTETVLVKDAEQALRTIRQLKRTGVRIAMDDFGTGYSSLSYLHRFPFDKIKIDRSFVQDIVSSEQARTIVQAIVMIANSREIKTVAEGVETKDQRDFLAALGCSEIQGYLISAAKKGSELKDIFQIGVAA